MMSFNDFVHKDNLKKKATSITKIYEALKTIGLDSKVGIYLRDGNFSSNYGILNLHPTRGTHWVCYIKDCYVDSYCISPSKKIFNYKKLSMEKVFTPNIRFKKMIDFVLVMFYM